MKEIGGYIELDTYHMPMLHENALRLNCGRNALAYLMEARSIEKLAIPSFLCDSVMEVCAKYPSVEVRHYAINRDFTPDSALELADDEWLYVVNFYGQLTKETLQALKQKYQRIIVDNAQAYFSMPLADMDTLYTCRKFFGVADGAILYTNAELKRELALDESFERMHFLLGRFERTAPEFYGEYAANNDMFVDEPIKNMSRLTCNLLHGIDYEFVKRRRTENYRLLHEQLGACNQLDLREVEGAFAYPLLIDNGAEVRKALQQKKIYIPTLWPNVLDEMPEDSLEYRYARDILPLPCDQRYCEDDMELIAEEVMRCINHES